MKSQVQPSAAEVKFALEAARLGVPRDQLRAFRLRDYAPQRRQLAFHAAARMCDFEGGPTRIGFGGARGPGKSHAMLAQAAMDDCQRFPGLKVLYLRKVGKAAKEAIRDQRSSVLGQTAHTYIESQATIFFPNGSRILLGNFKDEKDIDKYLGLEYDLIIIEEATTLTKSKIEMILTCLRTSKPGWRCRAYFTTNPGNVGHAWFKEWFILPYRAKREKETRFIPATVYDNQFVDKEYRKTLEKLQGWQRRAWLGGDWDVAAGQYFTNWLHERHVVSAKDMPKIGKDWDVWGGFDYGWTHWTMAYLLAKDNDGNVFFFDEHGARKTAIDGENGHAARLDRMVKRHGQSLDDVDFYAGHDCFSAQRTGGTVAGTYDDYGVTLKRANIDRMSGAAEWLRRLGDPDNEVEQTVWVSDRCERLIDCIPILCHDPHRPEDILKVDSDDDGDGGDDPYDAGRYGIMRAQRIGYGVR
jgi:phage terminase large subunit